MECFLLLILFELLYCQVPRTDDTSVYGDKYRYMCTHGDRDFQQKMQVLISNVLNSFAKLWQCKHVLQGQLMCCVRQIHFLLLFTIQSNARAEDLLKSLC